VPIVFSQAGIASIPIGGFADVIRTGELFDREYDYQDEAGLARDFTGLTVDSAIVYDPLSLAPLATIAASFGVDPALGVLSLSVPGGDMPAAGQYRYRVRATDGINLRTIQDGRFTVGGSP
jgi:hypothetical protein